MAFGLDDVIGAGLQIINKVIPDPYQKAQVELAIFKMKMDGEFKEIDAKLQEQQEVTKRQQNDMASDSWLSKNIRPSIMLYLLTLVTLAGFDVIHATVGFLAMIQSFTEYGLMFYFGGRTIEKVASMITPVLQKRNT
jgi:ABC-type multidrug transport system fused ATPase/permease subunit